MFKRKAEHVLVIKTDGLAAFVEAEPVFESIRAAHPNAQISLLTTPDLERIARAAPYFNQVAAMPNPRQSEARKVFIRQLKNENFSHVYDLAADSDARKLHGAMGPFRPKWHGASPARRKKGKAGPALPSMDKVFSGAGLDAPARLPDFEWALAARKDSANMQPSWFGVSGAFGLLLPTLDAANRWSTERYASLAQMMARASIMPVLAGGKDLHGFGDEVAHIAPELVDLCGKTDHLQLAALAQEANFFVSDCAEEVHLAVSTGCAGVLIRKADKKGHTPSGRHVMTLTADRDLGEVDSDFVWQCLDNMGLLKAKSQVDYASAS